MRVVDPLTARQSAMASDADVLARHIITFDPNDPSDYVFAPADVTLPRGISQIPWPAGLAPTVVTLPAKPAPEDALPQAEVLVVTWTVAEAKALADVLAPGHVSTSWYPYRRRFDEYYKARIRPGAPALASDRLASYALVTIGARRVLCMKSELHLSQDGKQLPVLDLWKQIIAEARPQLVITTGTAGAVGSDIALGDVVVSKRARFDCQKLFANAPFANAHYTGAGTGTSSSFALAERSLIPVNANRLPPARRTPRIVHGRPGEPIEVVTTDFFAFDDTTDTYGLRRDAPAAAAVEMGDAVLAMACGQLTSDAPDWTIVRNASDPQIDGSLSMPDQIREAASTYERYGYWTSVGSAIATWCLIAG